MPSVKIFFIVISLFLSCSSDEKKGPKEQRLTYQENRKKTLEDVTFVIKRNIHRLKKCYRREVKKGRRPVGSVTLVLLIRTNGEIKRAGVEVPDEQVLPISLQSCLIEELFSLTFPPPRTGRSFKIKQPLRF